METTNNNLTTAADFNALMDAHDKHDAEAAANTGMQSKPKTIKSGFGLRHDKAAAEKFLNRLDGVTTTFTFQTFDDNKKRRDKNLARVLNGTLEMHWATLVELNKKGAGVFITVNKTNLKGRKKENIVRARWTFADDDKGTLDVESLPLKPHIVVSTSGGGNKHTYWEPDSIKLSEFTPIQKSIIGALGTDSAIHNVDRVMRVAGFFHCKGEPYLVTAQYNDFPAYSINEIKAAFQPNGEVVALCNESTSTIELNDAVPEALQALTVESLDLLNRDIFEHNELKIYSAFECIESSEFERTEWLQCGMALYHSSGGSDGAFDMWTTWSSKDKARYKADEMQGLWDGFAKYSGETIGLGTLFKLCVEHGWDSQPVQDKTAIKLAVNERQHCFSEFNKYHGICMVEGKTAIVRRVIGKRGIDNQIMSVSSAREFYSNKYVVNTSASGGGSKQDSTSIEKKLIFPQWMAREDRRTYNRVMFEPVGGLVAKDTALPDGEAFNLYTGLARTPEQMPKSEYSLIIRHILDVWCGGDKEAFKYVLQWFANMLQNPHKQGGTVLLLHSDEGAGKNIITDMFMRAFGSASVQVTNSNDVTGRFNDHLATSVFVVFNEATWGGDKAAQGTLKSLITDDVLLVERKNVPKFMVDNCVHLIINTNNDYPAPVGLNDRRFVFLDLDECRVGDKEYFSSLSKQTTGTGQDGFMDYLLNLNIEDFKPAQMPEAFNRKSATKLEGKIRTSNSTLQWWFEKLQDGELGDGGEFIFIDGATKSMVQISPDWETGVIEVRTNELFKMYTRWCRDHHKYPDAKDVWAKRLRKYIDGLQKARPTVIQSRTYTYIFPPLPDCRDWLENKILKQDIDWN